MTTVTTEENKDPDYNKMEPSVKQRRILWFIRRNTQHAFVGTSMQDAYTFIGLHMKEAQARCKRNQDRRMNERITSHDQQFTDNGFIIHPSDFDVPNH
jgi:hypothetical protein